MTVTKANITVSKKLVEIKQSEYYPFPTGNIAFSCIKMIVNTFCYSSVTFCNCSLLEDRLQSLHFNNICSQ